ncbi:hypothetical protein GCM10011511_00190 [Puia dinghuensis]|uniref:Uncharacterized protein n=1 Tax=Puia dinghuensis TaxID=1792502 RepID=A0A8J2U5Z3_9BACT|nr:hypothetical protein GCM10011511_00190 [Puia dinghuensis]
MILYMCELAHIPESDNRLSIFSTLKIGIAGFQHISFSVKQTSLP